MTDAAPQPAPPAAPATQLKCPTCQRPKEWKGDKPGSMAKTGMANKTGRIGFRALSVKKGKGRPRTKKRDKRFVEFW